MERRDRPSTWAAVLLAAEDVTGAAHSGEASRVTTKLFDLPPQAKDHRLEVTIAGWFIGGGKLALQEVLGDDGATGGNERLENPVFCWREASEVSFTGQPRFVGTELQTAEDGGEGFKLYPGDLDPALTGHLTGIGEGFSQRVALRRFAHYREGAGLLERFSPDHGREHHNGEFSG